MLFSARFSNRFIESSSNRSTRKYSQIYKSIPKLNDELIPKPTKSDFSKETKELRDFVFGSKNLVAITGAGLSTESGLPDYRGPKGSYSKGHKPVTIQEFAKSEMTRKRFWARSFEGWLMFSSASPNRGHYALTKLQKHSNLKHIITQNVDGLHQKSGSEKVIELHGSLHEVKCMKCGQHHNRVQFQTDMAKLNPEWYQGLLERHQRRESIGVAARADGDIDLEMDFTSFRVPSCYTCGGEVQPGVVMFGDNVPRHISEQAHDAMSRADALLVAGTSLMVFSSFKFVKYAHENKIPIAIVNIGETRGDDIASLKVESRLGDILPKIFEEEL